MSKDDAATAAASAANPPKEPPKPLPVTVLEARLVWESLTRPNLAKVVRYFERLNRPIEHGTVKYWKDNDWYMESEEEYQSSAADYAVKVGLKPDFEATEDAELNLALGALTDPVLLRQAYRCALIGSIKASLAIARNSRTLAASIPHNMASGVQKSAASITDAVVGMNKHELLDQKRIQAKGAGIEPAQDEEDPLAVEAAAVSRALAAYN